jgi:DNA mismatch repair protein MutS
MDEVGRGTSTYDGLSLAWSILEYLHNNIHCRTLFATHYHELTKLSDILQTLSCHTMQVKEWENKIIFLYTVISGVAKGSYGIHVASLAGVPNSVLMRAKEILEKFEVLGEDNDIIKRKNQIDMPLNINNKIQKIHDLFTDISVINPDSLSPKEALDMLYIYVKKIKELE